MNSPSNTPTDELPNIENMVTGWLAVHGLDVKASVSKPLPDTEILVFELIQDKLYLTIGPDPDHVMICEFTPYASGWDVNLQDPSHFDKILKLWGKK